MKPLIVIPARGGSKRLLGKNIKPLNGKPLIHYTIEAALEVFDCEYICVSTDDELIKASAELAGLKLQFLRPDDLASDTADSRSVLVHAHQFYRNKINYDADVIVLLQPTSPFRTGNHIREAIQLFDFSIDAVISVKETDVNPFFLHYVENEYGYLKKLLDNSYSRKQDCPTVYEINGAIYIIKASSLYKKNTLNYDKTIKYTMDKMSSVDIDDKYDFEYAEQLLRLK
jgi:CMP-N,N'-diacetyllegionaminic acid synthase